MLKFFEKRLEVNVIFYRVLLVCAIFGVFYSFIVTPYTFDIKVFIAGANQVKYQTSNGLLALFEAWELKGVINRLLFYLVYRCTLLFVDYGNIYPFMVVSKTIYWFFSVLLIIISSWLLPFKKCHKISFALISYFGVFATFTASHMQAEMTVVLLGILVFSLLLGESKKGIIVGAAIGSLFFFTKSILILMFFSILACVVLVEKEVNTKRIFLSLGYFFAFEVFLLLCVYLVFPQEFVEMKYAAEFQTTLLSYGSKVPLLTLLGKFIDHYIQSCLAIPYLVLGHLAAIFLLATYLKEKADYRVLALAIAWTIPIDIIIISNKYFVYHFFTLVLPCIITIYLYLEKKGLNMVLCNYATELTVIGVAVCWLLKVGTKQASFVNYSVVMFVLLHFLIASIIIAFSEEKKKALSFFESLVLLVTIFFYANYSSSIAPKSKNMITMTKKSAELIKNFPKDFAAEPVLLLDSGAITFYNDTKSYSKYYYNLPMQRWRKGRNWDVQKKELEKLMAYKGKYIVYSNWFNLDRYPKLQGKIKREYVRLKKSGFWAYSPKWNMFQLDKAPSKGEMVNWKRAFILVRKSR